MALTDTQYKTLIDTECNILADAAVTANIELYWQMYDGYGQMAQYWYGRIHALQLVLKALVTDVDIQNGTDRRSANQQFKNVLTMIAVAEKQVLRVDPMGNAQEIFYSISAKTNSIYPGNRPFLGIAGEFFGFGNLGGCFEGDYSPFDFSYPPSDLLP